MLGLNPYWWEYKILYLSINLNIWREIRFSNNFEMKKVNLKLSGKNPVFKDKLNKKTTGEITFGMISFNNLQRRNIIFATAYFTFKQWKCFKYSFWSHICKNEVLFNRIYLFVEGIDDASLGPTFTKKIIKTFSYFQKMPQINQVFLSLRYLISKLFLAYIPSLFYIFTVNAELILIITIFCFK